MKRNEGVVLLMVILLIMLMSAMVYVAISVGLARSKAARFYENETVCLYAAEAGIAQFRVFQEDFENEYNRTWLTVVSEVIGNTIVITSTATLENSIITIQVTLLNEPIIVPQVTSLFLSEDSTINLNGSAFEIDGNNKNGIVTDGSSTELLLMIDSTYYSQINGTGGNPSVGEGTFDFNDSFDSLKQVAEIALGTESDPKVTLLGDTHLTGNQEAYGILLIGGDLTISGTFDFNGLIMVTGDLTVTGDMLISGSIMVAGDLKKVAGSVAIEYDEDTLDSAQIYIDSFGAIYNQVAWIKV